MSIQVLKVLQQPPDIVTADRKLHLMHLSRERSPALHGGGSGSLWSGEETVLKGGYNPPKSPKRLYA